MDQYLRVRSDKVSLNHPVLVKEYKNYHLALERQPELVIRILVQYQINDSFGLHLKMAMN